MSIEVRPYGGLTSLEHHLVCYGLATMFDGSRLEYTVQGITVHIPFDEVTVHEVIEDHFKSMLSPVNGWIVDGEDGVSQSPFQLGYKDKHYKEASKENNPEEVNVSDVKPINPRDVWMAIYARRDVAMGFADEYGISSHVMTALGRPQYWRLDKKDEKPMWGASQLMPRAVDPSTDHLMRSTTIPSIKAKLGVNPNGKQIIEALVDDQSGNVSLLPEFSVTRSSLERTILAIHGLWALPTSVGIGVPGRTAGCVYMKNDPKDKDDSKTGTYCRNNALTVLPVFDNPVSVAKVRSVVSDARWLPDKDAKGNYVLSLRSKSWAKEQSVKMRMTWTVDKISLSEAGRNTTGVPARVGKPIN